MGAVGAAGHDTGAAVRPEPAVTELPDRRPSRPPTRFGDWLVGLAVIAIVGLLFVPLPPPLVDLLLASNLAFSVALLLVAAFSGTPLRLASLPTVLLLSTLFRLALNVSTTRLILAQADAGRLIASIGESVVAGSLVVGGVVFAIVSVVHFVVIARGTERIAEVAARFALDALPGRQAALDLERRAGGSDGALASRRSRELLRESQLYGALDGATRFVKGDAIASLVITAINLVAGLGVGVGRDGLALADAARVYTVLTIGDGLAALIPSLLVATATGLVITRVAGARGSSDMVRELGAEVAANPRTLALVAGFLGVLALVPGMPWMVLGGGGLLCAGGAALLFARGDRAARREAASALSFALSAEAAAALAPALADGRLARGMAALRRRLEEHLGAPIGAVRVAPDTALPDGVAWRAHLDGRIVLTRPTPLGGDALTLLVEDAEAVVVNRPEPFLTIQRVHDRLDELTHTQPALVGALVPARFDHGALTEVLRHLVRSGLRLEPLPAVLDAIASTRAPPGPLDTARLAEDVREVMERRYERG